MVKVSFPFFNFSLLLTHFLHHELRSFASRDRIESGRKKKENERNVQKERERERRESPLQEST